MTLRVVTDSSCDLPASLVDQLGVEIVPLTINIGRDSYSDGLDMSRDRFYRELPDFSAHPTTSAPSPGTFIRVYERLVDEGATEIISIHISSVLSSVVNSARLAAEEIASVPVHVFDSRQLSFGTGFIVAAAARGAKEGLSVAEVLPGLVELTRRTHVFAVLSTVEFLRRSGRINGIGAGLATLLAIKPLLKMHDGVTSFERVRTTKRGFERLVELLAEVGPLEQMALVHANSEESAERLRRLAASTLSLPENPMVVSVTPVIGAHIGPGAVGFACVAAKR